MKHAAEGAIAAWRRSPDADKQVVTKLDEVMSSIRTIDVARIDEQTLGRCLTVMKLIDELRI